MKKIKSFFKNFHQDQEGATTTEYIIIITLIAIALTAIITGFGQDIANLFKSQGKELNTLETTKKLE